MRCLCLFILPFLFVPDGLAQSVSAEDIDAIEIRLEAYKETSNESNWDQLMDFLYPELFTVAPREVMAELFRQVEASGMRMQLLDMSMADHQDLGTHEGARFVTFKSASNMTMQLISEEAQAMQSLIQMQFDAQMGEENVAFEEANQTFKVFQSRWMLAIKKAEQWFFLDWNVAAPGQLEIMRTILPAPVFEEMNKKD